MNEKISSAFDGIKDLAENIDIKETVGRVGEKVKETVAEIDVKEKIGELTEKYKESGLKGALHEVGDTAREVAEKASAKVKDSLRDLPGAAINNADDDSSAPGLVKERTSTLNNNPRNTDMDNA